MTLVTGWDDPDSSIAAPLGAAPAAPIGTREVFLSERQSASSIAPRRDRPITVVGPSRVHSHVCVSGGIEVADCGATLVLWVSGELDGVSRDGSVALAEGRARRSG